MGTKLNLASYCQNCRNIEPRAVKLPNTEDVYIECEEKKRCEFLARYLEKRLLNGCHSLYTGEESLDE